MKEGPAEIYKRTRRVFFKSLMDGIGKSGAAVDYHFALLNLQRHDGVVPMDHIDQMLQKMVEPVLKQEEFADFWAQQEAMMGQGIPTPSPDAPWTNQPQMFQDTQTGEWRVKPYRQIIDAQGNVSWVPSEPQTSNELPELDIQEIEGLEGTERTVGRDWTPGAHTYGIDAKEGFRPTRLHAGGAEGIAVPEGTETDDSHWRERMRPPAHPIEAGRTWHQTMDSRAAGFDEGQGFENVNLLGQHHPLHGDYDYDNPIEGTLPPWVKRLRDFYLRPEGGGRSQSEIDHDKDRAYEAYMRTHPDFNSATGHMIVDSFHGANHYLGKSNETMQDIYERNYQNWLADNDILHSFHSGDADGDRKLRETHMNQAIENWLKVGQPDDDGHPIGMGSDDYHMGLEWHSPLERTNIHSHLRHYGTDSHRGNERVVQSAQNFEMARLKRNFWSRYSPMHEFFGRDTDVHGPNLEHRNIPSANLVASGEDINTAAEQLGLKQILGDHHFGQTGEDPTGWGLPKASKGGGVGNFKNRKRGYDTNISEWSLLNFAGIDPKSVGRGPSRYNNLEHYKKGEHPWYSDWDPTNSWLIRPYGEDGQSMKQMVQQALTAANSQATENFNGRKLRNAAAFWLNQYIDPHQHREVDKGHSPYSMDENTTMSTHWGEPYRVRGGTGRNQHILMDLEHQHTGIDSDDGERHSSRGSSKRRSFPEMITEEMLDDPQAPTFASHPIGGKTTTGLTHGFQIADEITGLMGPFSSVPGVAHYDPAGQKAGGGPNPTERRVTYETDEHGQKVRVQQEGGEGYTLNLTQAMGEGKRKYDYDAPPRMQVLNTENVSLSPKTSAAKGDYRRAGVHLSGPVGNHQSKTHYDNYMSKKGEDTKVIMANGRIEGKDSHLNIRHPTIGESKRYAAPPRADYITGLELKRAAQLGFHTYPLHSSQEGHIPWHALEEGHVPGGLKGRLDRLMQIVPKDKSGEFGSGEVSDEYTDKETKANELAERIADQKLRLAFVRHKNPEMASEMEDDIRREQAEYDALEAALEGMDVPEGKVTTLRNDPLDSHDAKYQRDIEVIGDEAKSMRQRWEDATGQEAFDPNDLWGSISNAMEFASKANTYVNMKDPSEHGHTSLSVLHSTRPTDVVTGGEIQDEIKRHITDHGESLSASSSDEDFYRALGMNEEDESHQMTVKHLKDKLHRLGPDKEFKLMTQGQMLQHKPWFGEDLSEEESLFNHITDRRKQGRTNRSGSKIVIGDQKWSDTSPVMRNLQHLARGLADPEVLRNLGVHQAVAANRHPRHQERDADGSLRSSERLHLPTSKGGTHDPMKGPSGESRRTKRGGRARPTTKRKMTTGEKADVDRDNALQQLESILISDPEAASGLISQSTKTGYHWGEAPIGNAGTPEGHGVHSIYDSHGSQVNWGHLARPTAHVELNHTGDDTYHHVPEGKDRRLLSLTRDVLRKVMPEILPYLGSHHPVPKEHLPAATMPNEMGVTPLGNRSDTLHRSDGPTMLASLTNPDVLLKIDGEKPPALQPMHRIFELDDLEHLKGFTGDWVVTLMPEGTRHFIRRKDDEIEAWSALGGETEVSDENIESLKKTTDKDFLIDTIYVGEECHVFDVLEFDGKDVHDMPSQERMKILRGGMESHEKVLLPAAYNTRLTDDAGLESAVKDLEKEGKRILLRDAKSTYMAGEQRHPKWVLLAPGNDVNLIVLERRGEDPYSYRLGTGPITQDEKMGERGVELDGETYMDVGTVFSSPKKYEVGDHVEVNVDSVTSHESDEETIYTIHAGSIEDEAEGEPLVSRDTLEVMTKSEPTNWPHEVRRTDRHVTVRFPSGRIIYKATSRGEQWMVHSPEAENPLLIRMAESQRPFWAPVVGMMLKGNLDMVEEERKEEVHESKGDGKPLIPPKKVEGTGHWKKVVEGLQAIEKTIGSVGQAFSGTRGLGIDYATPTQSPTGPTENKDQSALPDYDAKKVPEEDPEEPYEKRGDKPQSIDLPIDAEGEQGLLHVDDDTATLHIV